MGSTETKNIRTERVPITDFRCLYYQGDRAPGKLQSHYQNVSGVLFFIRQKSEKALFQAK